MNKLPDTRKLINENQKFLNEVSIPQVDEVKNMQETLENLHYDLAQEYSEGDGSLSSLGGTGKIIVNSINKTINALEVLEKALKRV